MVERVDKELDGGKVDFDVPGLLFLVVVIVVTDITGFKVFDFVVVKIFVEDDPDSGVLVIATFVVVVGLCGALVDSPVGWFVNGLVLVGVFVVGRVTVTIAVGGNSFWIVVLSTGS